MKELIDILDVVSLDDFSEMIAADQIKEQSHLLMKIRVKIDNLKAKTASSNEIKQYIKSLAKAMSASCDWEISTNERQHRLESPIPKFERFRDVADIKKYCTLERFKVASEVISQLEFPCDNWELAILQSCYDKENFMKTSKAHWQASTKKNTV